MCDSTVFMRVTCICLTIHAAKKGTYDMLIKTASIKEGKQLVGRRKGRHTHSFKNLEASTAHPYMGSRCKPTDQFFVELMHQKL